MIFPFKQHLSSVQNPCWLMIGPGIILPFLYIYIYIYGMISSCKNRRIPNYSPARIQWTFRDFEHCSFVTKHWFLSPHGCNGLSTHDYTRWCTCTKHIVISINVGKTIISSSIPNFTIFNHFYTMWGPLVISWFINPINYSYLRIINHIVIGVMFTNLAIENGGPTLWYKPFPNH